MLYKKGDVVKVYSLQSFRGEGFINGKRGIIVQDQHSAHTSVIVAVERKINEKHQMDSSYEVYHQQLKFVCHAEEEDINEFEILMERIEKRKEENLFSKMEEKEKEKEKEIVDDIPF